MDDKIALRISQAGMRFIAQMTIYNSGAFDRLLTFIDESYHPDLLAQESAQERLRHFQAQYTEWGKLRVRQVIGTGKHHVVVLLDAQNSDEYLVGELHVEGDYPHRVTAQSLSPLD